MVKQMECLPVSAEADYNALYESYQRLGMD